MKRDYLLRKKSVQIRSLNGINSMMYKKMIVKWVSSYDDRISVTKSVQTEYNNCVGYG